MCPFVILSRSERDDRLAIGDGDDADLRPVESLFNKKLVSRFAELLIFADACNSLDGFGASLANEDTFARRQSIGLDDDRHVLAILEKSERTLGVAKDVVVGRRHVRLAQQVFAKDLASFQLGGRLGRAKNAELFGLKRVNDPFDQRQFGTYNREANLVLLGELNQPGKVGRRDVDILGIQGRAGVTWGDENPLHARALPDFPRQGVFASAAADNQDVHGFQSAEDDPNRSILGEW